jgi:hypothetical protein
VREWREKGEGGKDGERWRERERERERTSSLSEMLTTVDNSNI